MYSLLSQTPSLFVPTEMFQRLVDCAMAGITIQHREACKSILSFLSDVFDLPNSSDGGNYREFINIIVLQRGATLTRIMIAALTGALPSGRLEEVCCKIVWCFLCSTSRLWKGTNSYSPVLSNV